MFQKSRKEKIEEILKNKKESSIRELSSSLGISISTIHRDINELVKENKIIKSYGEVKIKTDTVFANRLEINSGEKIKIAKKCLELIEENDSLFLENSTTCYYLAKEISKSDFKNLTIITNSVLIPKLFQHRRDIQIIATGGIYFRDYECFAGPVTSQVIREFNGNKFLFSVGAISIESGLSDLSTDLIMGDFKKEMAIMSKKIICLVDSTKFNKLYPKKYYSVTEVDKIVTDSGIDEKTIREFKKLKIEIVIAE